MFDLSTHHHLQNIYKNETNIISHKERFVYWISLLEEYEKTWVTGDEQTDHLKFHDSRIIDIILDIWFVSVTRQLEVDI